MVGLRAMLLVAGVALWGCNRQQIDPVCEKSRQAARQLAAGGQTKSARVELEHARATCPQKLTLDLDRIDLVIAKREEQTKRQAALLAVREQKVTAHPLADFIDWIRAEREAADKNRGQAECAPRGQPDHGWCVTTPKVDAGPGYRVLFWEANAARVFRFEIELEQTVNCAELGKTRPVRSWRHEASELSYCEFVGGALGNLGVLIEARAAGASPRYRVEVFSEGFLDRSPEFERRLRLEGR